jgi:hypothetical protein
MQVWRMLGIVAAITVASSLTGCSSNSKSSSKDITVSGCTSSPTGGQPKANGSIDNHSSKASTYAFRVVFADTSGNTVSQGAVAVGKVNSGAKSSWQTTGAPPVKGALTCKVSSVVRTVAP